MTKRDWSHSKRNAKIGLLYMAAADALVPVFHLLMDPDVSREGYLNSLLISTRIGVQIGFTYWLLSTCIYAFIHIRRPELRLVIKRSIPVQAVKGLAILLISIWISSRLEPLISGLEFGRRGFATGALIGGITMLLFVVLIAYRETAKHNLELRAESAEANLHILKNQMQPHFLFNSLNSLSELIEADRGRASEMTQKLADLYRQILENSKHQVCSLRSEAAIITNYLELEALRFGARLQYQIALPSRDDILIPALVLQTLVENAIKHGISRSIEGGRVEVKIEQVDDGFQASVINTAEERSEESGTAPKTGTGLSNTMARLKLLYGDRSALVIRNRLPTGAGSGSSAFEVRFWFSGFGPGARHGA